MFLIFQILHVIVKCKKRIHKQRENQNDGNRSKTDRAERAHLGPGRESQCGHADGCSRKTGLSFFIGKIRMKNIRMKNSQESKLFFISIFSIRIRSRTWDNPVKIVALYTDTNSTEMRKNKNVKSFMERYEPFVQKMQCLRPRIRLIFFLDFRV